MVHILGQDVSVAGEHFQTNGQVIQGHERSIRGQKPGFW